MVRLSFLLFAAACASPANLQLSDIAGRWNVRALAAHKDSVLTKYQLWTSTDTSAWKIKFDNRADTIPVRVLRIAGDSILIQTGPYHSILRNTMVTTQTVLRFPKGELHGSSIARYDGLPADSALRVRTRGTRADRSSQ